MAYLVLARKYRPQTFDDVVEQHHVTRTLKNAIQAGRVAHAILFSGPRGTGKTTVARILAKAVNCQAGPAPEPCNTCRSCREITEGRSTDVFEIDGASNNSVDQVRELRENSRYMPVSSRFKIYIIDEVHMLSTAAFNALLKTLEEPPDHVMFIFATTEPHKVPVTIHSRCQRYDMRRVPLAALVDHMKSLCDREGIRLPQESLVLIGREAGGSVRDALSLLDQVMTCTGGDITHDAVLEILGTVDRSAILEIGGALLVGDLVAILSRLQALHDRGHDLRKLYGELLGYFRDLLVIKLEASEGGLVDLPLHEREEMASRVVGIPASAIHQIFDLLYREEAGVRLSAHPKLALEMGLMRVCRMRPALSIDELIKKVDALRTSLSHGAAALPPPGKGAPPAGPAPEEGSPPEPPGSVPGQDPETLWSRACEHVCSDYPALTAGLRNTRLLRAEGSRIEIQVEGSAFVIGRIKRPDTLKAISEACGRVFGREVEVVLHEKAQGAEKPTEKKKRERRFKQEALKHPAVVQAIELFNGKVVEVNVFDGSEPS